MSTSAGGSSKSSPKAPDKSLSSGNRTGFRAVVRVVSSAILAAVVLYGVWTRGSFRSSLNSGLKSGFRSGQSKPSQSKPGQPLKTLPSSGEAAFEWVPHYPGSVTEDISNSFNHDRVSFGFHFHIPPPEKPAPGVSPPDAVAVRTYYETQLRAAGFIIVEKNDPPKGDVKGDAKADEKGVSKANAANPTMLHAESPDGKRVLELVVIDGSGVQANVMAIEK